MMVGCRKDTETIRSFKKDIYESYVCSSHMVTALVIAGNDYAEGKHFFYPQQCAMVDITNVNLSTARIKQDAFSNMTVSELSAISTQSSDGELNDCVYCSNQREAMSYVLLALSIHKIPSLNEQMLRDAQKALPAGNDFTLLSELYSYAEKLYNIAISEDVDFQTLCLEAQSIASDFEESFAKSDEQFPNTNIDKVKTQELAEKQISIYIETNK